MRRIWTDNIIWKLLSLLIAILIWIVVLNVSNPEVTRTKTVPLEVENEDIITGSGKLYEIIGGNTVNVSYTVRAGDEKLIKTADFRAYVDLANLYDITGAVPVSVEVIANKDLIIGTPSVKPGVMRVNTEDLQKKEFALASITTGEPTSGFSVGSTELEPKTVFVSGAMSLIGQISKVGVEIDVSGAGDDLKGTAKPVFYDANGNKINLGNKVTVDKEEIEYKVTLLRGKTLALNFNIGGDVAQGYRFTGVESATKSVSVIGLTADLAGISVVDIPSTLLNIDGATEDKTIVFDINEYLPENISVNGPSQVSVTLKVEALNKKSFRLSLDDINAVGHTYGYLYKMEPEKITVVISGISEELNALKEASLGAQIDYTHLTKGRYQGVLTFNLPSGFVLDSYTPFELVVYKEGEEIPGSEESPDKDAAKETAAAKETSGTKETIAIKETSGTKETVSAKETASAKEGAGTKGPAVTKEAASAKGAAGIKETTATKEPASTKANLESE